VRFHRGATYAAVALGLALEDIPRDLGVGAGWTGKRCRSEGRRGEGGGDAHGWEGGVDRDGYD
jgi:hypothetical protein